MTQRPRRARRSQLSVPGSSEKMLQKGAESAADHVFCDLEDAVAPSVKVEARDKIAWALNTLDWGKKTRCVRINDVTTEWCHGDIITVVEKAGANIDTIMLTKPYGAADVVFLDRMLLQLEKRLKLDRRIGIEVLIEEVQALQNVEEISRCSDRLECLIFGMGDYSGSQGIDTRDIGGDGGYPGDIFHYARWRITMAARAAGIDASTDPTPISRTRTASARRPSGPRPWAWSASGPSTPPRSRRRWRCFPPARPRSPVPAGCGTPISRPRPAVWARCRWTE